MKIILTRPYSNNCSIIAPPLGLAYLSSYLKERGYPAEILDGLLHKLTNDEIVQKVIDADLIGINCMTIWYSQAVEIARKLKSLGKTVVLGGPHASIMPQQTLKDSGAEYIVVNEGEETFFELVKAIDEKKRAKEIKGLLAAGNGKFDKRDDIKDLDSLSFPDWEQTNPADYPDFKPYQKTNPGPVAPMVVMRGCNRDCRICFDLELCRRILRKRSPRKVAEESAYLMERFGVKEIHFENMVLEKEYMMELAGHLNELAKNLCWGITSGVQIIPFDDNLLSTMKKAGCTFLGFELHSGDRDILNKFYGGSNLSLVENIVKECARLEIFTTGHFKVLLAEENEENIKNTLAFIKSIPLNLVFVSIVDYNPEKKPELNENLVRRMIENAITLPQGLVIERLDKSVFLPHNFNVEVFDFKTKGDKGASRPNREGFTE